MGKNLAKTCIKSKTKKLAFQPGFAHLEYLNSQNPGAIGQFFWYEAKNAFKALIGHPLTK